MGKQYNKLIKRRRRLAYHARRKAAASAANPDTSRKAKSPVKKSTRKKAAPVEKSEPLAEKAKAEDVLGPDVVTEDQANDGEEITSDEGSNQ